MDQGIRRPERSEPRGVWGAGPQEAVKDADILVTDTWVTMSQEAEKIKRMQAFEGFQITADG
jgi:ornithine carbamoyltransferase